MYLIDSPDGSGWYFSNIDIGRYQLCFSFVYDDDYRDTTRYISSNLNINTYV